MARGQRVELDALGRKLCSRCKEHKNLSEYSPAPKKAFGVESWCKVCVASHKHASYDYRKMKDAQLRVAYGINLEDYERMLEGQSGVCACCGKPETNNAGRSKRTINRIPMLHVDHCHTTGRVRGLLCSACNQALGLLEEKPERVKSLLQYIESYVQEEV